MNRPGPGDRLNMLFINSIQMFGGGEVWMLRTLSALRERGHRVHLMCRRGTKLAKEAALLGINVCHISVRGDFDPVTILRVFQEIKRRRIHVVLTNMDKELRFGGIAARLAGVRAIIPRRGIDYPLKNRLRYRFAYTKLASCVVANSRATKETLLRNAPWLDPSRVRVIYNGVAAEAFAAESAAPIREQLGIPEDAKVVGFVGQLDERKGVDYLLEAFRMVSEKESSVWLLVVGEGPLEKRIRATVDVYGIGESVVLSGFRDDVTAVMSSIDLLVLPSLWEGFGIVLIEAMAAGKPVVTTNVSSMPEIVEPGVTGYLVPPRDARALADAMLRIICDPGMVSRMGREGRKRVLQQFTLDTMVQNLEECFRSMLSFA